MGLSFTSAFILEVIITSVYIHFGLRTKIAALCPSNSRYLLGFAVSQVLLGFIILDEQLSGAAFNPAVGFSLTLFNAANNGWSESVEKSMFVYIVGPFLGGAIAAIPCLKYSIVPTRPKNV
jgi:glycerol uptake facilitator-like aquaporin